MPTTYLSVTAIHVSVTQSGQPTTSRIVDAFRQTFSPDKGWTILGGAPRITRRVAQDSRPTAQRANTVGLLTLAAGVAAAPFTFGMSLVGPAISESTRRAVASVYVTTASAVVATGVDSATARQKIQREFASKLGAGWTSTVVEPYSPAINGPLEEWQSGSIQRASSTTDQQGIAALLTARQENPVGPTPPNAPTGPGIVTAIASDVSGALRAGVANVTGAAGDGLENINRGVGAASSGLFKVAAWGAVIAGAVYLGPVALPLIAARVGARKRKS